MKKKHSQNKKLFSTGSFNVRGIVDELKQAALANDMVKYGVDVCSIQETKVTDYTDTNINGHRIVCLPAKVKHYGMGFMISPKWSNRVHNYWSVSERIAVLQLKTDKSVTKVNSAANRYRLSQITKNLLNLLRSVSTIDKTHANMV